MDDDKISFQFRWNVRGGNRNAATTKRSYSYCISSTHHPTAHQYREPQGG
uniref:Uncharacterized protein n=1 Tax=Arundo donax TaxID=35708 RepID=A0A0A9AIG9_ARUDO